MSYNTKHIEKLVRDLSRGITTAESATERDALTLDLLTSIIETAENERSRLVGALRQRETSWAAIALCLGVSKQAAQQRYGSRRGRVSLIDRPLGQ